MCANTALNNVYGKVRTAVRESEIRRQERERLGAPPQDGRY
jgi:hypothetical protein